IHPEAPSSGIVSGAPLADGLLLSVWVSEEGGSRQYQIWRSDGTAEGTFAVHELSTFRPTFFPDSSRFLGNRMLFSLGELRDSLALWITDGTEAGTHSVLEFPEENGVFVTFDAFEVLGNRGIMFLSKTTSTAPRDCEMWAADGTTSGTRRIASLADLAGTPVASCPSGRALLGKRLYFGPIAGDLWRTDGTLAGTVPAVEGLFDDGQSLESLITSRGMLWFVRRDGNSGRAQLFRSNGTPQGTLLLGEFGAIRDLHPVGDRLLIDAGGYLWVTDGSAEGTFRLFGGTFPPASSFPESFVRLQETLLFSANSRGDSSRTLWATDGSEEGTRDLSPESRHSYIYLLQRQDDRAYFVGGRTYRGIGEAWTSDGTRAGTRKLAGGAQVGNGLAALGDDLHYIREVDDDWQLWRTDGTPERTFRIDDFCPGAPPPDNGFQEECEKALNPRVIQRLGNRFVFLADDLFGGRSLWASDGTTAGTGHLADLQPDPETEVPFLLEFTVHGDRAFLFPGPDLWVTDGTPAGTLRLTASTDPPHGPFSSPVIFRGRLFFLETLDGDTLNPHLRLWSSDGSPEGTRPAFELPAVQAVFGPPVAAGSRLFFAALTPDSGIELWVTDGTPAGTAQVQDIAPGAASSAPANFRAVDGVVLFAAGDGASGHELWRSDGTEAGTWPVGEIEPGVGSSKPGGFTPIGDQVFFAAYHSESGMELWTIDRQQIRTTCSPDSHHLCLGEGRFEVVVDWYNQRTGARGTGAGASYSDDTGFFSFFDEANVDLLVKMLDGRERNGRHWFFSGALTDVEYWITVTDFETGRTETFHNPAGNFCGLGDSRTFDDLDVTPSETPWINWTTIVSPPPFETSADPENDCTPGSDALLLLGGRFAVQVS
ncbi:MAG: hypothetical protein KDD47_08750, partial [Acidobacteria bacterium]|nr:hypothetical protein [Acidobacteriota bacterium]